MSQPSLGRITRSRSRAATSAVSIGAPSPAAFASATAVAAHSLSAQIPPADHAGQAQEDAGEGKEEAVEVGGDGGGVVDSTDSGGSNVHSGHRPPNRSISAPDMPRVRPGHVIASEPICTLLNCSHCCKCHVRHPRAGYGSCTQRVDGRHPWPDCECHGACPPHRCAQYECSSRLLRAAPLSPPSEPCTPRLLDSDDINEEKMPPSQRRHSDRARGAPALFSDEQAELHFHASDLRAVDLQPEEAKEGDAAVDAPSEPARHAQLPCVADIASHPPLYPTLQYALHPMWIDRCEPYFRAYKRAFTENDVEKKAEALLGILQLPGKYLRKQRVPKHVRRMLIRQQRAANEWQTERLRDLLRDSYIPREALQRSAADAVSYKELDDGADESKYDEGRVDQLDPRDEVGVDEADMQAVVRSRRLVKQGFVNMASRAVATDHRTLDCGDPAVIRQLQALHPPASNMPMPQLPPDAFAPVVHGGSTIEKLVRRCNNGKAGGPSGWNGALLAILAPSRACMNGLRCILQDIVGGTLPRAVRPHMTATRLIALAKPNGSPRPIAMGELFYRMAAVHAVQQVQNQMGQLLAPHQYGIGVPGGCEHIVHCMQHSLTDLSAGRPQAAIKIDISNAFNTCQRPRLLSAVLNTAELAPIHRLVHWAYSEPTVLVPQSRGAVDAANFIPSANGVRQGDPLSSLLFCLYLKPAIDALLADPVFGGRISVYAYIDDVHIVGSVDDVLAAHTAFTQHLHNIDLAVNPAKCSLLYFHETTHPTTPTQLAALRAAGLQWDADCSDSADLLGAVIGISTATMARRLHEKLGGANGLFGAFFRRVGSGGFSVQAAMLLLAHSVGRLSFLLRCLPSAALEQVAKEWDTLMLSAAATVLDLAPDEIGKAETVATLQRPRRLGGFGLPSALFVSPLAFIASVAASAAQSGGHPLAVDELPAESLLHQWLHTALTCPVVEGMVQSAHHDIDKLHTSAGTFTGHYHNQPDDAAHLQSKLTTVATNILYNARVREEQAKGNKRGLARLYGGRAKYASRWKMVKPTEPAYQLSDEFYRYSARRDLGLAPTKDRVLPRQCAACGLGVAADGLHGQRCVYNSAFTKMRHDAIEQLLHETVRDGIGLAYRQEHGLPAAARTVPDLLLRMDNKVFLCDITVTDTLADSNLATACKGPARLANAAAKKKVDKYDQVAAAMGAVHLPFAVESMGGLSNTAQQLLREIHNSASSGCSWRDAEQIGTHLVDSIAVAVQCCSGMALRASVDREMSRALGVAAA